MEPLTTFVLGVLFVASLTSLIVWGWTAADRALDNWQIRRVVTRRLKELGS